jgi:RNA polymerase primary sigma factor
MTWREVVTGEESPCDLLALYFRDVGANPLITRDREIELALELQQTRDRKMSGAPDGNVDHAESLRRFERAREALTLANLRLVIHIARKYAICDIPLADLIQEGNIGLLKAVDRFDYRRGNRFSTYAYHCIRRAIERSIEKANRVRCGWR